MFNGEHLMKVYWQNFFHGPKLQTIGCGALPSPIMKE
jgi:hypothetical protein